jgi:hypothetical protein
LRRSSRAACRYSAPSSRRTHAGSIGPIGLPDVVVEPNSTFGLFRMRRALIARSRTVSARSVLGGLVKPD